VSETAKFPSRGTEAEIETGTGFTPKFDSDGLLPVVVTSAASGEVLMLAYMNADALARTLKTSEAHFWSRSRHKLWRKGEESRNVQRVVEMRIDCDQDTLLLKVDMQGAEACCHTGRRSCFYRAVPLGTDPAGGLALRFVEAEQLFDPDAVYGHSHAAKGNLKRQE
jgi:phosphoribosyl-AMP cyclohydrolase